MVPLISDIPADVGPGELIRAQDYNIVLAWLRYLDERLAHLEGADDSVLIMGVIPSGLVRVGDMIEIIGRNFGYSLGAHRVYFNSTRATIFSPDSGDTRLIVIVPQVPGITEAGTQVLVTVGNQASVDTVEVTLRPAIVAQEGSLGLLYTGATVGDTLAEEIPENSTVRFHYDLESDALLPTIVTLMPDVSVAAWQDGLEIFDSDGELLTSRQIQLQAGQQTSFSIQLEIPAGTVGTEFTLDAEAHGNNLPAVTDSQTFTVGEAPPQVDPAVHAFRIRDVVPPDAQSGNTLEISSGQTVNVQLQGEFAGPAADEDPHVYTFIVDAPPAPWERVVPSTFPPFAGPVEFTVTGPDTQDVSFGVTWPVGVAANPATLICHLQREDEGDILEAIMQFNLQPV